MQLKQNLTNSTSDFWYDLSIGGYLNPIKMCERKEDAEKIIEAVKIIKDFQNSCENQIEDFNQ